MEHQEQYYVDKDGTHYQAGIPGQYRHEGHGDYGQEEYSDDREEMKYEDDEAYNQELTEEQ